MHLAEYTLIPHLLAEQTAALCSLDAAAIEWHDQRFALGLEKANETASLKKQLRSAPCNLKAPIDWH